MYKNFPNNFQHSWKKLGSQDIWYPYYILLYLNNETNLYYSIIFHSSIFLIKVEWLHLRIIAPYFDYIDMDTAFPTIVPLPQFPHFMTTWSFEKELHNRVTNMTRKKRKKKKREKRTRVHPRILARPIGNFLNEPRPIFSKIITSVSPVIRVIGPRFPFSL